MALFISNTVDFARSVAPYWTGTLAFSHRGEIENMPGQIVAYMYLDPTAVNPVTGNRPVDYGPVVHESQPWIDWTMEWLMDEILVDTEDRIIDLLYDAVFNSGSGPERIFSI